MTERSVERAIADRWLDKLGNKGAYEIGAVTPYYWPHRIRDVVDPYDSHELVSCRDSIFNVSLNDKPVISISTIEHIGMREYGQEEETSLTIRALEKILAESPCFLITAPLCYNTVLDNYIGANYERFPETRTSFLYRGLEDNVWSQVGHSTAARATYGPRDYSKAGAFANAIVILER
jgi:hypothetical protein